MPPLAHASRTNVGALSDEELVRLARGDDGGAAQSELVARHFTEMEIVLASWARRFRLSDIDREDMRLQTVLALQEALHDYNTDFPAASEERRFHSFLMWLVRHRVIDSVRMARHREKRVDRSVCVEDLPDRSNGPRGSIRAGDPAELVIQLEFRVRFREALRELTKLSPEAVEALFADRRLRDIAHSLGLTPRQVKRLRQRVRGQLADHFKDWKE